MQTAVIANNLAYLLAQPDTASEAEKLIDAALVELGPNADVLDTRGVVLLAAGKTEEAIATLQDAVLVPSAVPSPGLDRWLESGDWVPPPRCVCRVLGRRHP